MVQTLPGSLPYMMRYSLCGAWNWSCARLWCCCCEGVFPSRMQVTEDGFEETWAVNVLAPFVLNAMLLQHVQERIINVSSISADSRLDFNNLNQAHAHTQPAKQRRAGHACWKGMKSCY